MKKFLAMLLLSVMSLSLVACGGEKEDPVPEGQEAINITAENWDTYFEIEEIVDTGIRTTDDGEEVTVAYVDYMLCLKDEYKDTFASADLKFTYVLGEKEVKTLTYNLADGTYEFSESKAEFSQDTSKTGTLTVTDVETQMHINLYADAVELKDMPEGKYVCDTALRPALDMEKVEGRILVTK